MTHVGEHKVRDQSNRRPVCNDCGAFTVPSKTLERVELNAALIVFEEAALTGETLRFARKALGMTQSELAERLGTAAESISRWERGERAMEAWVPLSVTGLIRARLNPHSAHVELLQEGA
jgi:DNA-binding XRE family transcriptional regulator